MKPLITFLFLLPSVFAFSQTDEIVKILNRELEKEIGYQKEYPEEYRGIKFEVVKKFSVKDSIQQITVVKADGTEDGLVQTEMKILSLEVKKKKLYEDGFYTEKQEVDLRKIKSIIKDINIIFKTEENDVTVTTTQENGEKDIRKSDMFFLHLSGELQNEYLGDEIVKVLKKAGYEIKKGSWYD